MGVQYSLWGGSIFNLGTEKHKQKYLEDIDNFKLPGAHLHCKQLPWIRPSQGQPALFGCRSCWLDGLAVLEEWGLSVPSCRVATCATQQQ